jgi:MFS family permease
MATTIDPAMKGKRHRPMRRRFGGLWRHPDFLRLWAGQTVSLFGSAVTEIALPLTAIALLGASAAEMGVLRAVEYLPFLLAGPFVGVWVDRRRRRPLLVAADLGRAALLASVPVAWWLDRLTVAQLYAVAFLVGGLTVVFDVSSQSFRPTLVGREQLAEGNGKLEVSESVAQMGGPGLGGLLLQVLTAPVALLVDALSFVLSALCLGSIRATEPAPCPQAGQAGLWREIGEGWRLLRRRPELRAMAGYAGSQQLGMNALLTVYLLYLSRELRLGPALIGLLVVAAGPGTLLGATLAGPLGRRFGLGPTLVGSALLTGGGALLIPLADGPRPVQLGLIAAGWFLLGLSSVYDILALSLRQAVTPERLRGRVNASMSVVFWGAMPIGALLGGLLGQAIGFRPALVAGAVGTLLASLWVVRSPLPALRKLPPAADEPPAGAASSA